MLWHIMLWYYVYMWSSSEQSKLYMSIVTNRITTENWKNINQLNNHKLYYLLIYYMDTDTFTDNIEILGIYTILLVY